MNQRVLFIIIYKGFFVVINVTVATYNCSMRVYDKKKSSSIINTHKCCYMERYKEYM